jgi:hypothetical protein
MDKLSVNPPHADEGWRDMGNTYGDGDEATPAVVMPEHITAWGHFGPGSVTGQWSANQYDRDDAAWYIRADLINIIPAPAVDVAALVEAMPDALVQLLREIGIAEWGAVGPHDAATHADNTRKAIENTAEHFGQTGPQQMHGLYVEGTANVICHTGTGPNAGNIARVLTQAWNTLRQAALAAKGGTA